MDSPFRTVAGNCGSENEGKSSAEHSRSQRLGNEAASMLALTNVGLHGQFGDILLLEPS